MNASKTPPADAAAQQPQHVWANYYFHNPRLWFLTIAIIVVGGLSSFFVLPRAEDPSLARRFAQIKTFFPGASADRVESLVTDEIEDALQEIEEIKSTESTSATGISIVAVELADWVPISEIESIWSRVRDQVSEVEPNLPPGAGKPEVDRLTITAYTLLVSLSWEHETDPQFAILRRVAEDLEDDLRILSGTAEVDLFGAPDEEVRVEIDAGQLAHLNLTAEEVARAIRDADSKTPAGELTAPANNLVLEVAGDVETLDRIREVPIRVLDDGRVLRVADVAHLEKAVTDPPSDLAFISGRPSVVLAVRMQDDLRVDSYAADARRIIDNYRQRVPRGLSLELVFDQSEYVKARLDSLTGNLLLAMGLVICVIFVLMGWRAAVSVGAALPLASLMVLMGMRWLEVPIHQMSVTGLIVALGLLIDNAIVIVDEVRRRIAGGRAPADAIAAATKHLAIPLLGSTFTTALAFMPIVLMPGPGGEFVGAIGVSVILAITSSLFLAMTVIPTLAGFIDAMTKRRGSGQPSTALGKFSDTGIVWPALYTAYRGFLRGILRYPALGVLAAIILPISGFVAATQLPEQFFPPTDRDQFTLKLRLPAQASIEQTTDLTEQVRALMLDDPSVVDVHWFLGNSAPQFYYNLLENEDGAANYAQAIVQLDQATGTTQVIRRIQAQLDDRFPQARALALQLEQGPPFTAPVELRLFGPDLNELRRIGNDLRAILAEVPNVTHTRATLEDGRPQLEFQLDEAAARVAGFTNVDVARTIRGNFTGVVGGTLLEATEELPIRVRVTEADRDTINDVNSLALSIATRTGPDGERPLAPLAAFGHLELTPERSAIPHYNGRRANVIQGYIEAGILPATVLNEFLGRIEASGYQFPPGYVYRIGGEAAERDEAVGNLLASVSILAVMMIATLVLIFGSFRIAAMLGFAASLSLGLGFAALWVFGHPFGFMAIIGTMGLVGVAMNDSIVVLAAIREDAKARLGEIDAMIEVTFKATRHVVATTVTTCAGFMPLLLDGGRFWPPLAVAIGGGVLGATLIALVLIPSSYRLLMARRQRPSRAVAKETAPENSTEAKAESTSGELTPEPAAG